MAREQGAIFFSPATMTEMTRLVHRLERERRATELEGY